MTMGWGERHKPPLIGGGTTGEMSLAQDALAAVGVEKPNLALAAIEAAGLIDRLRDEVEDWPRLVQHHQECEHAGEAMRKALEDAREALTTKDVYDAEAYVGIIDAALALWNEHQWPDLP